MHGCRLSVCRSLKVSLKVFLKVFLKVVFEVSLKERGGSVGSEALCSAMLQSTDM